MSDTTLVVTRVFDAPVEAVWNAWTDGDKIRRWWGSAGFTCPAVSIDFREGGKYLYCMRGAPGPGMPVQDFWSAGTFEQIVPMRKIVVSDHFGDAEGTYVSAKSVGLPGEWADEMVVTTDFEDMDGGKTKVTVTHEGHPKEMVEPATHGWNDQLDKLAAVVSG